MVFQVDTLIKDFDGTIVIDEDKKQVSYGRAITNILMALVENEPGEDKIKSYNIAAKVAGFSKVDLEADEITFINRKTEKLAAPLIVGRMKDFLSIVEKPTEKPVSEPVAPLE